MEIDLKTFERNIHVRNLEVADFEEIVALQHLCFPTMPTWKREMFESQIKLFHAGQFCVEFEGKIVASSSSLIVDYSDYSDWHAWRELSDSGYIRNHDEGGDTLYGIEIMVHPDCRGMRLSRRLYDARKHLCRERNLARMMIGGRIPGYLKVKEEVSAARYVEKVINKDLVDPVLTAQLANGFILRQLIPDYLPSDEDSAGYATCMEWPNFDYVPPKQSKMRRAVLSVRIGLVQFKMRAIESFADFEQQCTFYVDSASDSKSDFVLFPELFTLQLLSLVKGHQPGQAARKLAEFTKQYLELFTHLAVKHNINIIGGSQFTQESDGLYNVAYLFRRDGTIEKQYKLHITPSERRWWGVQGGDKVEVFDTDRGKIAIVVCYDVEFPEIIRIATKKGARILFVPFNTNDRYGYLRVRYCAQARCIENQIYVAMAGCVGNLPNVENADIHYAQSALLTPSDIPFARDGIATESSPNIDTVLIHDVDTELLRRARGTGTVQNWNDRRQDMYKVVWSEGDAEFEV
jgi:predicted amidohydrolase/GNAT superfamily N-acetyltransferase